MNTTKETVTTSTKISTSLPTQVWDDLVKVLRKPFSRAEPGKLDKGDLSAWVLDAALHTIANRNFHSLMEKFIEEKGLTEEFQQYFAVKSELL